jgi:hypothetical protein
MRVPIAVLVACSVPALASPQSLGDAARSAAGKRAPEAAAKPYTDDDLRAHHLVEVAAPPSPAVRATASAPAGTSAKPKSLQPASPQAATLATTDPVREMLDREADRRRQRDQSWKAVALASVDRLRRAERMYQAACSPQAIAMAGG